MFNVSVLRATRSPLGLKGGWGGGDRKREQGDKGDREKKLTAPYKDFLNGSVQF